MTGMDRRSLMAGFSAGAAALPSLAEAQDRITAPLRKLAGEAQKVTIKSVTTFDVHVPQTGAVPPTRTGGPPGRINVTCVETDSGVKGYSFLGSLPSHISAARPVLVGAELFAIERHLQRGLIRWGGIEEAIWDAIGKIAGQPVARLL